MAQSGMVRENERDKILHFAREGARGKSGLLVLAPPLTGVSSLLGEVYDRLFETNENVFPVYFSFKKNDESAEETARRFLRSFLLQGVAFRRRDRRILSAAPEIAEIAELAAPADGYWIDRLLLALEEVEKRGDAQGFIRQSFGAPLRAAAQKARSFLIFDDFHHADPFLIEEIKRIYARASVQFVIGGHRRALVEELQTGESALPNVETIALSPLTFTETCALAERLSYSLEVQINEQTRDLLVLQLEGNPAFIANLIQHAAERKKNLDSFQNCQQVYIHELLHGRINRCFSAIFKKAGGTAAQQREIIALLHNALTSENSKSAIESWRKRLNIGAEDFNQMMRELHRAEILQLDASFVEVSETSLAARDYVAARFRLEVQAQPRALVLAEMLAASLKRAPKLMARYYRRTSAFGLRKLLSVFNLQEVPAVLFDYAGFRQNYRGFVDAEAETNLAAEKEKLRLPQIVYAANCAEFYPPIERLTDAERSAVALGFESGNYRDENQIVWIAAEIESKIEADAQIVEFWLDRLEAVAVFCNFERVQYWLIAPEGFTDEACDALRERGAFGSSRKQVELLAEKIKAENLAAHKQTSSQNEFELIVPMGDDTELIAAQAVEEIARRYNFKPTAINQIKTALVEACINASEHSLSPERKIYQKFALENDQLVITVANRGLQITPEKLNGSVQEENPTGRRGFGLRLIRSLMDEVEFIRTDDGTQIRMTKRK
jgi:serine/threonine-protein kinase RsbW